MLCLNSMYIRAKRIKDRKGKYKYRYYYLVQGQREGDKVISRHVAYLGKSKAISAKRARKIAKELGVKRSELKKVRGLRIKACRPF